MLHSMLKEIQNKFIDPIVEKDIMNSENSKKVGMYLPLTSANNIHRRIVRILVEECYCLNSKDKVKIK